MHPIRVIAIGLLLLPLTLAAQAPRYELTGQFVAYPVSNDAEDASAGDSRLGAGVRIGYRPSFARGRAILEVHANVTPVGDVPTASGIRTFGALLATTLGPVGGEVEVTLGTGVSRFTVEAHGEDLCLLPYCVVDSRIPVQPSAIGVRQTDEVRALTRDGSHTAVMVDGGVRLFPGRRLGARVGVRLYAPTDLLRSGASDNRPATRWELSVGLMARIW